VLEDPVTRQLEHAFRLVEPEDRAAFPLLESFVVFVPGQEGDDALPYDLRWICLGEVAFGDGVPLGEEVAEVPFGDVGGGDAEVVGPEAGAKVADGVRVVEDEVDFGVGEEAVRVGVRGADGEDFVVAEDQLRVRDAVSVGERVGAELGGLERLEAFEEFEAEGEPSFRRFASALRAPVNSEEWRGSVARSARTPVCRRQPRYLSTCTWSAWTSVFRSGGAATESLSSATASSFGRNGSV